MAKATPEKVDPAIPSLQNWTGLRTRYMKKPLTMTARGVSFGAGEMNRTPDLLITNELLYRLSYTGEFWKR